MCDLHSRFSRMIHMSSTARSGTQVRFCGVESFKEGPTYTSYKREESDIVFSVTHSGVYKGLKIRAFNTAKIIRSMSVSSSSSSVVTEDGMQQVEILTGIDDEHEGVIVDLKEPMDSQIFGSMLKASISQWRKEGKKGVWLKLPIELVNLVEAAVKEGFWYHHAEPRYIMLIYWIPETPHTLPANATHRVGIGAFVMNDNREVLVVQEKYGKYRDWKFPTGAVDEGEDIFKAATREVKEETGIDAEFIEVLAFRQSHKSFFEKSDLFFLCMLRPFSFDIQKQDSEIEAAQWMPIEEYTALPSVQKNSFLKYMVDICVARKDKEYAGFSPVPTTTISSSDKECYFYFNSRDLDQPTSIDSHLVASHLGDPKPGISEN